jgi:hypothetical protein
MTEPANLSLSVFNYGNNRWMRVPGMDARRPWRPSMRGAPSRWIWPQRYCWFERDIVSSCRWCGHAQTCNEFEEAGNDRQESRIRTAAIERKLQQQSGTAGTSTDSVKKFRFLTPGGHGGRLMIGGSIRSGRWPRSLVSVGFSAPQQDQDARSLMSGNTLVPITRPLLKEFYKKHPPPELHSAFASCSQTIASLVDQRGKQAG